MGNRVTAVRPHVGDHTESRFGNALLAGDLVCDGEQVPQERARTLPQLRRGRQVRARDQEDVNRLFKPFSQGRNITDGVAGPKGTGLGLYIVKSIIDQHGGKVDVRSTPGEGTQISFSLKVAG